MSVISDAAIQFMAELQDNNNKEWFDANRARYERDLRDPFKRLRDELAPQVNLLAPELDTPKISRINNDIRFAKDKPPYKEHCWIEWSDGNAGLGAGIDRHGWSAMVCVTGEKREDLDLWRRNLIDHHERWHAFAEAVHFDRAFKAMTANPFKKDLYENIPDDVRELVQARQVWIVQQPNPRFSNSPTADFITGIALLLPVYYFMSTEGDELVERLDRLGKDAPPPDDRVSAVWRAVQR